MKTIDNKDNSFSLGKRKSIRKHRLAAALLAWAALMLVLVLNWNALSVYLFRADPPKEDSLFKKLEEGARKNAPSGSFEYLRRTIGTQAGMGARTMLATKYPDSPTQKYQIHGGSNGEIEVGLARIEKSPISPSEFVFSVYELKDKRRRKLLETSQTFPVGSWPLFKVEAMSEGQDGDITEIEYVLKPRGLKGRIASAIARVRGLPPYYKDFAFLAPNVLPRRKPDDLNVLLISFDTLRPDHLGCFGYSRPTSPNLDAFAKKGVLFTQAVSTAPWTGPAHQSLLSGLYPSAHITSLSNYWDYVVHSERAMPVVLKEKGYYTIGFTGGAHVSSVKGFGRGFNRYLEFNRHREDSVVKIFQNALGWMEENRSVKFFMFLHTYECHTPNTDSYFLVREEPADPVERMRALYDGDLRNADRWFGRLVEKLQSLDLLSKTIIVIVSDHGEDLRDHFTEDDVISQKSRIHHGHSLYDEVIRVLTIFHLPGLQPNRHLFQDQISLVDVMPTVLDYLGVSHKDPMQGTSLLQLMKTGERMHEPPAFSESLAYGPERKSVRMNGYKYIYTVDPNETRNNIAYRNIPRHALFDLRKDSKEKNNIYEQNKDLAGKYHKIMEETMKRSSLIRGELEKKYEPVIRDLGEVPEDVLEDLKALGYL